MSDENEETDENPQPEREEVGQPETPIPGADIPDEEVPEPAESDDDDE